MQPVFWIVLTYLTLTYGPVVWERVRGKATAEEMTQALVERSPEPLRKVFGEETSRGETGETSGRSNPATPSSPAEIPRYIREVIDRTISEVVTKTTTNVEEKRVEVVTDVCGQIIEEIEKTCSVQRNE